MCLCGKIKKTLLWLSVYPLWSIVFEVYFPLLFGFGADVACLSVLETVMRFFNS